MDGLNGKLLLSFISLLIEKVIFHAKQILGHEGTVEFISTAYNAEDLFLRLVDKELVALDLGGLQVPRAHGVFPLWTYLLATLLQRC